MTPPETTTGCRVCGKPLTDHQRFAGGLCDNWRCKERWLSKGIDDFRGRAAESLGVRRPEDYPPVIVAHREWQVVPLPEERRREFLEHLSDMIEEAIEEPELIPEHQDGAGFPPPPLLARICETCEGECCHRGGTHAFVTPEMIQRVAEDLGLPMRRVYEVYEELLPESTYENSCVFHSATGCALTRELRPVICNRFECKGLDGARKKLEEGTPRVFVAFRSNNLIARSAFVDESETRKFEPGR